MSHLEISTLCPTQYKLWSKTNITLIFILSYIHPEPAWGQRRFTSEESPAGKLPLRYIIDFFLHIFCTYNYIYLLRNIIVVGGSMSYNSTYGQDTLTLRNATNKFSVLQNEGAIPICFIEIKNFIRVTFRHNVVFQLCTIIHTLIIDTII